MSVEGFVHKHDYALTLRTLTLDVSSRETHIVYWYDTGGGC